mgnify:CR=1 FL=1
MCDWCGSDEEGRRGREAAGAIADRLRALASNYDGIANRRIRPHSDDTKPVAIRAKALIRQLVEDWL